MKTRISIGIDTSGYTTSVAAARNGRIAFDQRAVLFVQPGERGLRQSEAVFQHIKNLPELIEALFDCLGEEAVDCVAVSAAPTEREGSYMPVFLAGRSAARSLAAALRAKLIESTHQRGHIRAALVGNEALLKRDRFLALHLSGGTTDVLEVSTSDGLLSAVRPLGASRDLHLGQFVDRMGVYMGLPFPSGKQLEALAEKAVRRDIKIPSSVRGLDCSFSGAESAALRALEQGAPPEETAYGVYDCMLRTLSKLINNACEKTGLSEALLCGGVSSSGILRQALPEKTDCALFFGEAQLSSDNACGTALIGGEEAE